MYRYIIYFAATFSIASSELVDSNIYWDSLEEFDIKGKMVEHKLVPIIVPVAPEQTCHVRFRWGEPKPGDTIPDDEDKVAKPTVTYPYENDTYYLVFANCYRNWHLIQNDAEYARNHSLVEYHEWVLYNVRNLVWWKADTLYDYKPCPVPIDTNVRHLVVYFVFKQNEAMKFLPTPDVSVEEFQDRKHLSTFVKRYKLGNPVAGNFYYVRYDEKRGFHEW